MQEYVILSAAWFLYFFIHSFFASIRVKYFFEKTIKNFFRIYRFLYSSFSTVGLLALLIYNATIPPVILFESTGIVRYLSLVAATFGVIVFRLAFREYRFLSFIGLRQEAMELKRTGILNRVRHPIYSGTILIVVGFFLFIPTVASLVSVCCILVYLPIGIYLEEKKLKAIFGEQYTIYKKEVPSVFPNIFKMLF
jgi:methanethiol S-methyltransferase